MALNWLDVSFSRKVSADALALAATFWTQDVDCQGLPRVNDFAKP